MMLYLVIVPSLIAIAFAEDPTKICFPDQYQSGIYIFGIDLLGTIYYDFPNKELALKYDNGIRNVFNLTTVEGVSINETDGACVKLPPNNNFKIVSLQCLPAEAVLLTNNSNLGLVNSGPAIEAWELDVPGSGVIKFAFLKGPPYLPLLREFNATDQTQSNVILFVDAKTTIDNRDVFKIPPNCSPAISVG